MVAQTDFSSDVRMMLLGRALGQKRRKELRN
jgi:hypothetical protein